MIDNLTEAIIHTKEKAKELSDKAYAEYGKTMTEEQAYECNECAREHEQLAEWLTELQERREADRWIPVSERLPNKQDYYYVWVLVDGEERPCVCWFSGDFILNDMGFKVLAWKNTLCKPYKESEVNNEQD